MKRLRLLTLAFGFCLAMGLPLAAMAGPIPTGAPDTDADGVEDAFDNCTTVKNPTQVDTDHDGCGQFCDFDWNNDGIVKAGEVNLAGTQFGLASCANPPGPPFNNCVCAGEVNAIAGAFGKKPGPSGITNAVCIPARCACTPAP